nr:phenylacetate--CoA ligase family protein [Deltaproteobacteria bacterium]
EDDSSLTELVGIEIRRKILVRCKVELVPQGSLPRTERKSKRVFDQRNGE